MSSETFLLICCGYIAFCVVFLIINLLFSRGSVSLEDSEKSQLNNDVNRMRHLQDIAYYRRIFRNKPDQ